MTPSITKPRSRSLSSRSDQTFQAVILGLASMVLLIAGLYAAVLLLGGIPAFAKEGLGFFFGTNWDPVSEEYQAFPFIVGTFVTALGALVIATPLAIASALFVVEYAPKWLAQPVANLVELLAAIPSVVYGLWGLFVMLPIMRSFQTWFVLTFPSLGWAPTGIGLFSAMVLLAIMVIPFISAISRDVIRLVPNDQREAAYALGATKWEVIRYGIFPYARAGILGGVILGLGRAVGETLAVTMVIGNANRIAPNLFAPTATMSSVIASNFNEALGAMVPALIAIGFVLFVFTMIINYVARIIILRLTPQGIRL